MTDFAQFTEERLIIVTELAAGNGAPLAKHLDDGGELYPDQRAWLIKYLRKELGLKRGNRSTWVQKMRDSQIRFRLCALQRKEAMLHGSRGSYRRAIDAHLALDPSVHFETLRKHAKRGLLTRGELDVIDKIRDEIAAEHPE